MYPELNGRVVIITGAARGIGQCIAATFAGQGSIVVAADILDCAETAKIVSDAGGVIETHKLDVTNEAAINAMVADVMHRRGRVDVLVNNAGILDPMPFETITLDIWNRYLAINTTSQFLLAKAVIPHMRAQHFGRIINLASGIVLTPLPNYVPYMASKNAVIGLTRGLATEMGEHGITVNAVSPSYVSSPGQIELGTTASQPIVTSSQAIKRDCVPTDLAPLILFLASDGAAFITAQTMHADGGLTYK